MGLPWPPTWEEGVNCLRCNVALFSSRTPKYVYAECRGITRCGYTPPDTPDPNQVILMTQSIGDACFWEGGFVVDMWDYSYGWTLHAGGSSLRIMDISGMWIFRHDKVNQCDDTFVNQLTCGAPLFPGFSGGAVNCFW